MFRCLSADDGSDQALQRMLGINNDNLDCFLDGDLKEGLGKLDDNMMRYILIMHHDQPPGLQIMKLVTFWSHSAWTNTISLLLSLHSEW